MDTNKLHVLKEVNRSDYNKDWQVPRKRISDGSECDQENARIILTPESIKYFSCDETESANLSRSFGSVDSHTENNQQFSTDNSNDGINFYNSNRFSIGDVERKLENLHLQSFIEVSSSEHDNNENSQLDQSIVACNINKTFNETFNAETTYRKTPAHSNEFDNSENMTPEKNKSDNVDHIRKHDNICCDIDKTPRNLPSKNSYNIDNIPTFHCSSEITPVLKNVNENYIKPIEDNEPMEGIEYPDAMNNTFELIIQNVHNSALKAGETFTEKLQQPLQLQFNTPTDIMNLTLDIIKNDKSCNVSIEDTDLSEMLKDPIELEFPANNNLRKSFGNSSKNAFQLEVITEGHVIKEFQETTKVTSNGFNDDKLISLDATLLNISSCPISTPISKSIPDSDKILSLDSTLTFISTEPIIPTNLQTEKYSVLSNQDLTTTVKNHEILNKEKQQQSIILDCTMPIDHENSFDPTFKLQENNTIVQLNSTLITELAEINENIKLNYKNLENDDINISLPNETFKHHDLNDTNIMQVNVDDIANANLETPELNDTKTIEENTLNLTEVTALESIQSDEDTYMSANYLENELNVTNNVIQDNFGELTNTDSIQEMNETKTSIDNALNLTALTSLEPIQSGINDLDNEFNVTNVIQDNFEEHANVDSIQEMNETIIIENNTLNLTAAVTSLEPIQSDINIGTNNLNDELNVTNVIQDNFKEFTNPDLIQCMNETNLIEQNTGNLTSVTGLEPFQTDEVDPDTGSLNVTVQVENIEAHISNSDNDTLESENSRYCLNSTILVENSNSFNNDVNQSNGIIEDNANHSASLANTSASSRSIAWCSAEDRAFNLTDSKIKTGSQIVELEMAANVLIASQLMEKDVIIKHEVNKNKELEIKLDQLEAEYQRIIKVNEENDIKIIDLTYDLECYQKKISQLVTENESITQKFKEYQEQAEINSQHLLSLENTFSDLHAKYERTKKQMFALKSNEPRLISEREQLHERLKASEMRYEKLKNHTIIQLEHANDTYEKKTKQHENEINRMKIQIKRVELEKKSETEALQQKIRENQQLHKLLDELNY